MRITGPDRPGIAGTRKVRTGAGTGGAAFAVDEQPATVSARSASPSSNAAGIGALLSLQTVEDPVLARRKNVRKGRQLLDLLEEMRADLLVGTPQEGRLNRAMALVGLARDSSEPGLDAVLDEIELRVRVELAKQGRF